MEAHIPIKTDADVQMFFAGRDEQNIEKYFQDAGFISPKTKRTYKGFGKPSLWVGVIIFVIPAKNLNT